MTQHAHGTCPCGRPRVRPDEPCARCQVAATGKAFAPAKCARKRVRRGGRAVLTRPGAGWLF